MQDGQKALKRVSEVSDLWTSEQLKRGEGRQPTWLSEPGLPKTKSIGVSGPPCTVLKLSYTRRRSTLDHRKAMRLKLFWFIEIFENKKNLV